MRINAYGMMKLGSMITKKQSITKQADKRQAGMAAILITMVTMVVVSLIVIGFVVITSREQGQTLDQQLSTQAFYAAESGVNDAQKVITDALTATPAQPIPGKRNCTTYDSGDVNYNPTYAYRTGAATNLDNAHNVSYSCLLVDPDVKSLVYQGLGADSRVIPITTTSPVTKVKITWTPPANVPGGLGSCPGSLYNNGSGNGTFSPTGNWTCNYGVLRADLVPTTSSAANPLTTNGLASSTLTGFFEPLKNGGSGNLAYPANTGKANLKAAQCVTANSQCTATMHVPSGKNFSLRLNFLYASPATVTITALGGSTPVTITGTQVMVDSTGNANGVLRRIQVRLPAIVNGNLIPDDAIQTNGSLCKRFDVAPTPAPGYFTIPGNFPSGTGVTPDGTNAMCKQAGS